jgi:hypothetical protein
VGGYVLQETPSLSPSNWVNDTNAVNVVHKVNQVTEPASNTAGYYRLVLPVSPP